MCEIAFFVCANIRIVLFFVPYLVSMCDIKILFIHTYVVCLSIGGTAIDFFMQTWHSPLFMTDDADPTSFRGSGYIYKTHSSSCGNELLLFSFLNATHNEYALRF